MSGIELLDQLSKELERISTNLQMIQHQLSQEEKGIEDMRRLLDLIQQEWIDDGK